MNLNELSNFDLNCMVSIKYGHSEKWVHKHSDLVFDYCYINGRDAAIKYLTEGEL